MLLTSHESPVNDLAVRGAASYIAESAAARVEDAFLELTGRHAEQEEE